LCGERQFNVIKPDGTSARKLPFAAARNSQPSHADSRILHSAVNWRVPGPNDISRDIPLRKKMTANCKTGEPLRKKLANAT
jgi:hypothetical protein